MQKYYKYIYCNFHAKVSFQHGHVNIPVLGATVI